MVYTLILGKGSESMGIIRMILSGSLLLFAIEDIRHLAVTNALLVFYTGTAVLTGAIRFLMFRQPVSALDGLAWEACLLLTFCFFRSAVGEGDLWVLSAFPLFLDPGEREEILLLSLLSAFIAAVMCYAEEKDKRMELPYMPFLCGAVLFEMGRKIIGETDPGILC